MQLSDPYKLVETVCKPIGNIIPDCCKFKTKGYVYGFLYGSFQTTMELTFFGQVINYSFTKGKKPFSRDIKEIYKTWPKNWNGLIPYYSVTRALQFGLPKDMYQRKYFIRSVTPLLVLPYEHVMSRYMNRLCPSVPVPVCSIYQNFLPYFLQENIYEFAANLKPTYQATFKKIMTNGWAQLLAQGTCNFIGYFIDHPANVVSNYMKSHPSETFVSSVMKIHQSKGIAGFYVGAVHRCTRAFHSAIVTSLAGVAFDTLFFKQPEKKEEPKKCLFFF